MRQLATRCARGLSRWAAVVGLVTLFCAGAAAAQDAPPAQTGQAVAAGLASPPPQAPPQPRVFDPARADDVLTRLQNRLATTTDDEDLATLARRTARIEAAASRTLADLEARATQTQAEIRRIPVRRRPREGEAEARAALLAQSAQIQAAAAQARGVAVRADALYNTIAERRRAGFSGRVLQQTASPLEPDFWTSVAGMMDDDVRRLGTVARRIAATALAAPEPRGLIGLAAGVMVAIVIAWPLRRILLRLGRRRAKALDKPQAAHVAAAVWRLVVEIAAPTLAIAAIRLGARWGGLLARPADQLADGVVSAVAWAATVLAVGHALGVRGDGGRGLLRLEEAQARRGRSTLWVVALVTASGAFLQRLNFVVGASVAATIAANALIALAYAAAAFLILLSFGLGGARDVQAQDSAREPPPASPVWTVISLVLAAAIVGAVGAVLLGYTTLAALIAGQIFWLSLLGATTYILIRFIDEIFGALFRRRSRTSLALQRLFGLRGSTIAQIGLLISATLQLVVLLLAVLLAITPFGQSGQLLLTHLQGMGGDFQIGKVSLSPTAIAGGVLTLFAGVGLTHLARSWVERRYLPVTAWDIGVRNSVATGVSYLGVIIALICGLAVTGVGVQQMALVASALSVGIGFGLQQIVQNFVAGVILLVERPVKVGDWINVGGVEGDVLDIRVRATDIRGLDGSTVIVPNSSLITTNVQNKTRGGAKSRIQLQLTITKAEDVSKARDAILEIAAGRPEILKEPPPKVFIEALTAGGGATLSVWMHIADPRAGQGVRSDLYFALLEALQQKNVAL